LSTICLSICKVVNGNLIWRGGLAILAVFNLARMDVLVYFRLGRFTLYTGRRRVLFLDLVIYIRVYKVFA
jgi:hypothetical protein